MNTRNRTRMAAAKALEDVRNCLRSLEGLTAHVSSVQENARNQDEEQRQQPSSVSISVRMSNITEQNQGSLKWLRKRVKVGAKATAKSRALVKGNAAVSGVSLTSRRARIRSNSYLTRRGMSKIKLVSEMKSIVEGLPNPGVR